MTLVFWALGVVGAAAVAFFALLLLMYANAFYGLALPAAVAGATALAVAAVQERRSRGAIHLRHCLECGASVLEAAGFCPRCHSVRLEEPASAMRAPGASPRTARTVGREMPVTAYSTDSSGVIGWVDAAPPGSWAEGAAQMHLRRWGLGLLALAIVCASLGLLIGV